MTSTSNSNVRSGDFQPPANQSIFGVTTTMRFSVLCCLALSLLVEAHGRTSSSYYRDSSGLYPSRQSYRGLPFAASYLPPSRRQQHMTNPYELYSMRHEPELRQFDPVAEAMLRMGEMGLGSSMRHRDHILKQTRTQSALMAEQYLANIKQDEQCFHLSYCQASVTEQHTTGKAAKEAIKVMQTILETTAAGEGSQRTELPHVQQLVAAYNVGEMTKNAQLCQWLFPCGSNKQGEQRAVAADNPREARFVTCKHISRLCPGVSLSCGLCAVLSPESCSVVCPVGAIYCGTSGYSCLLDSLKPDTEGDDNESDAEEAEVEADDEEEENTEEEEAPESRTTTDEEDLDATPFIDAKEKQTKDTDEE